MLSDRLAAGCLARAGADLVVAGAGTVCCTSWKSYRVPFTWISPVLEGLHAVRGPGGGEAAGREDTTGDCEMCPGHAHHLRTLPYSAPGNLLEGCLTAVPQEPDEQRRPPAEQRLHAEEEAPLPDVRRVSHRALSGPPQGASAGNNRVGDAANASSLAGWAASQARRNFFFSYLIHCIGAPFRYVYL